MLRLATTLSALAGCTALVGCTLVTDFDREPPALTAVDAAPDAHSDAGPASDAAQGSDAEPAPDLFVDCATTCRSYMDCLRGSPTCNGARSPGSDWYVGYCAGLCYQSGGETGIGTLEPGEVLAGSACTGAAAIASARREEPCVTPVCDSICGSVGVACFDGRSCGRQCMRIENETFLCLGARTAFDDVRSCDVYEECRLARPYRPPAP